MTESGQDIYYDLRIEASSSTTEIWLGDSDGHFVQRAVGALDTSLRPGRYVVEFGLGTTTYPISLVEAGRFTEERLRAGPSCPRPAVRLAPDES